MSSNVTMVLSVDWEMPSYKEMQAASKLSFTEQTSTNGGSNIKNRRCKSFSLNKNKKE